MRDLLHGSVSGVVDDFVVRRGDGGFAYNLAVVVDDTAVDVDQVVRGDDLLPAAINQAWLAERLGADAADVRARAARRQRGRSAAGQARRAGDHGRPGRAGAHPGRRARRLAASLGLAEPGEPVALADLLPRFDPARLPRDPWVRYC